MATAVAKQLNIKTMFSTMEGQTNGDVGTPVSPAPVKKRKGKLEDIYQKKTQLEHILLRPDTYIGSVEMVTEAMWVYDNEKESMTQKEVSYVPGLYKIFDEILVNAADHKQRDPKMDTIKIEIDQETNTISIYNNGQGIPVAMHKTEKMFVPTMIFGHLLTSSNYDDDEQKVTGGRNGYGAKLCNIFSSKFTVETTSKEYKKSFKQTWGANMSKASDAKIKDSFGPEYTKITFIPDLKKFKMESLNDDIVAIMSRRAYDIAASCKGVRVFLNGKRVQVKNFKEYVDLFIKGNMDDAGNQIKCAYEQLGERWEIALAPSYKGFQQMSFVNSIATTKGGRHVDYIADIIVRKLTDTLKKKYKSGLAIRPFQVKSHMWVFINCLIVNPTFDSQTKENMTLQAKSFGSKCALTDKFVSTMVKCGIVEAVMTWAKFKEQTQLLAKCSKQKRNKITGIPKLEDANDAGTKYSSECTLILTEGDSAKTLAVAGLSVIGRDRYGVFPLKGKLLNVREASHKQILENAEINNVIKILGLQYQKTYPNKEDLKVLRYGKLMIMTDQDQDGSHIKGLLINFIHHNWPSLLKVNFVEQFITPIVKATKGKEEHAFYSIPEFEEWKSQRQNSHTYKIKYYKGLGTSTSKEAKEYFTDIVRHRIKFNYDGIQDDHAITMAFSKKHVEERKEWLTSWMLECKRRKELGLADRYLYEKDTKHVTFADFVNKELVIFSNLDNERSIPSMVDGLKPGQRKVMFTCFKRNDKKEIKVAQLSGSVAEHSAYHHGEVSLMSTIINLAHDFVGSNNVNLLKPIGQFGTRLLGGKDAASPRYIFTQLSSLTRLIFHPHDEAVLNFLTEDNQKIEPRWYMPIIPMILVNGTDGIGTGWSTKIPNFNPREIVSNIKRMINDKEPKTMIPWYKNFKGSIELLEHQKFVVYGEIGRLENNQYEITELPVGVWTQPYKESVVEALLTGTEKITPLISDMRDHNTDSAIHMVVTVHENKMQKVEQDGPHVIFKLQTTLSTANMVCFDPNGCIKTYVDALDILREFYDLRLTYYKKRKDYLEGMLGAEACKLSNQARFILEKCSGKVVVEKKKRKEIISDLQRKGYDTDPVKLWRKAVDKDSVQEEGGDDEIMENCDTDYDYLLGMPMWNLTQEKIDEILKKRDEKQQELAILQKKTIKDLWLTDLDKFIEELDKVEKIELAEELAVKLKLKAAAKSGGKKRKVMNDMPSLGERVLPQIGAELKKKTERAAMLKEGKGKRVKKVEAVVVNDEFDDIIEQTKSLSARLGNSPDNVEKKLKKEIERLDESKETKSKRKKGNFDDIDVPGSDDDIDMLPVVPRERPVGRRAAADKVKFQFDSSGSSASDSDSEGELSLHSNEGVEEPDMKQDHISFNESSFMTEEPKKKSIAVVISDTDSEFEDTKIPAKKTIEKPSASEMFDSLLGSSSPTTSPVMNKAVKRPKEDEDSDSDDNFPMFKKKATMTKETDKKNTTAKPKKDPKTKDPKPKTKEPKSKPAAKKVMKKKAVFSDSEEDFSVDSDSDVQVTAARITTGRGKKSIKYNFGESDNSDSDF